MVKIKKEYYGFGEYSKPLKETKAYSNFPNPIRFLCRKISQLFHYIIKSRVPPHMGNLDKEIRVRQPEDVSQTSVGEWTKDNSILVTKSAAETIDWKLELIKSANHSIEISGTYAGGEVFRNALKAIKERITSKPDLKVNILIVPDLLEKKDKKLIKKLHEDYPNNFHCLQSHFQFNRKGYRVENHVKLVLIDEKYYVIGGTNYQDNLSQETKANAKPHSAVDKLMGAGSVDMDIVGKGVALASVMRREFFKLQAILEIKDKKTKTINNYYQPIPSENATSVKKFEDNSDVKHQVKIKAIVGCPENSINDCTDEYVRLVNKIGKSAGGAITLAHMYFHPPQAIQIAIRENITKIQFTVITTGVQPGAPVGALMHGVANSAMASWMKRKNLETKAYFSNKGGNIYHKKVGIFRPGDEDKEPYLIMGSYNLGGKSRNDYEMCVVIKDQDITDITLDILKKDIKHSVELTSEQAEDYQSLSKQALGKLQNNLYPIFLG